MGASVTTAFDSGGRVFALGASFIVLMGIGLQLWGLSGDRLTAAEFQSVLRYSIPNIAAMALLITGSFLGDDSRIILWLLFVLSIVAGVGLARRGDWIIRPGHFAERHGLIVIIALGEVVVAIGSSVVASLTETDRLPNPTLVGLTAAGALASLLWWSYFDRVLPSLEHRGNELTGRPRAHFTADVYTGLHILIVGGIIAAAAATEEILLHPTDEVHTEFLVMFVAGIAMFYGGIALAVARGYRVVAKERIVAVALIAILASVGRSWEGVTLLVAVDVVILLTLIAEQLRVESPSKS